MQIVASSSVISTHYGGDRFNAGVVCTPPCVGAPPPSDTDRPVGVRTSAGSGHRYPRCFRAYAAWLRLCVSGTDDWESRGMLFIGISCTVRCLSLFAFRIRLEKVVYRGSLMFVLPAIDQHLLYKRYNFFHWFYLLCCIKKRQRMPAVFYNKYGLYSSCFYLLIYF